jgi:hypothetical protein
MPSSKLALCMIREDGGYFRTQAIRRPRSMLRSASGPKFTHFLTHMQKCMNYIGRLLYKMRYSKSGMHRSPWATAVWAVSHPT